MSRSFRFHYEPAQGKRQRRRRAPQPRPWNALIFTPDRNSHGKRDYTGAFRPRARAFAKLHEIPLKCIVPIDQSRSKWGRRQQVLAALAQAEPGLDVIAFFCHGLRRSLPSMGFGLGSVERLADAMAAKAAGILYVPLYACLNAGGPGPGGDGGFADELRDALCRAGSIWCRVDAHSKSGHTDKNPWLRRFDGEGSPVGGQGGQWIVKPGGPLWRSWVREMRRQRSTLRLRVPFLGRAQIHEELTT
jgi:hypothetical protein